MCLVYLKESHQIYRTLRPPSPKLSSLEKFGSWLELNTTTTPSVAPKTPPENKLRPMKVESPPPQQPTKHTGKLLCLLPKFDNPPTTIKDKIIAQLETKLLDIDTSNSTIKFGKENKSGHQKLNSRRFVSYYTNGKYCR